MLSAMGYLLLIMLSLEIWQFFFHFFIIVIITIIQTFSLQTIYFENEVKLHFINMIL